MNVAFYAPMKPPDHPVPSGDRLIAGLLLKALRRAGHAPRLVSRFRSYEGRGDARRQERLKRIGLGLGERVVRRLRALDAERRPRCFLTYHLYHKAPDWIGPVVSRALDIPYLVAEASLSPRQARGPWREGHRAAAAAIASAQRVIVLNSADVAGLRPLLGDDDRLVRLNPFLDLSAFAAAAGGGRGVLGRELGLPVDVPWLACVAMMRAGNKLDSYRVLARALGALSGQDWRLLVIGDGPARGEVESAFAGLASSRVRFLGLRRPREVGALVRACDLFVWPAVAEPLGMAMLEAQAAGVPVVAGGSGGVGDIVRHGETGLLCPPGDTRAFAAAVAAVLADEALRRRLGEGARARAFSCHGLDTAAAALDRWITGLVQVPAP